MLARSLRLLQPTRGNGNGFEFRFCFAIFCMLRHKFCKKMETEMEFKTIFVFVQEILTELGAQFR